MKRVEQYLVNIVRCYHVATMKATLSMLTIQNLFVASPIGNGDLFLVQDDWLYVNLKE